MPTLPFVTVDVFTATRYAGNPLAIVRLPAADAADAPMSTAQMQRIANEFNLSETVFLHAGTPTTWADNDSRAVHGTQWRLRIFMVGRELPFAGHPTIGAACYALQQQWPATQQLPTPARILCNAGPIDVKLLLPISQTSALQPGISAPDPPLPGSLLPLLAAATIPHDVHVHAHDAYRWQEVRALQPALTDGDAADLSDVSGAETVAVVSPVRGMTFVLVALRDLDALGRVAAGTGAPKPRRDPGWDEGFAGMYFYVPRKGTTAGKGDEEKKGMAVRTRMVEGAFEDAATGSAACALAAYLALSKIGASGEEEEARGKVRGFDITQGVEMGRESRIGVQVTLTPGSDAVERLVLSGTAVKVMEGTIEC